jgi:ribosomal protein S18 acetylase RimI-like enzyme
MNIIKVGRSDLGIIHDILVNHIDTSDKKAVLPTIGHLHNLLDDNRSYLFAAVDNNLVFGYALAYRFPSLYSSDYLAYLYDIEVSKSFRRKGIGRLLIEKILEHLRLDNVKELWLGTGIDNQEGQGLFSATGAIKSEEAFNDYTYYLDPELPLPLR